MASMSALCQKQTFALFHHLGGLRQKRGRHIEQVRPSIAGSLQRDQGLVTC
jgi:hypothetical protein